MRLLVVGASGFIGTNLILKAPRDWLIIGTYNKQSRLSELIEKHNLKNVELVKCDLTKEIDAKRLAMVVGHEPINVLYLAGNSDPQLSYRQPLYDLEQNAVALLNFLSNVNVNRLVYFSSGAVYDGLTGNVDPTCKLDPKLPYAISKLVCEQYVKHFHANGTVKNYVIVRFFGAYGPYEPERKIYTKLIKAFYINKQNTYEVYGDGTNLIDAMYVDDAIDAIIKILTSKSSNLTVDLCTGSPISINELVERAAKAFGVKDLVIKHAEVTAEPIRFRASQKGIKKHFGITIKHDLESSLKRFAAEIKKVELG